MSKSKIILLQDITGTTFKKKDYMFVMEDVSEIDFYPNSTIECTFN